MKRAEQKEERRKQILVTALRLFVERGYYDTKVSDIAAEVPMSVGLMFHYFESKEVLLLELVKMGLAGPSSVKAPENIPPDVFLEHFLGSLFSYAKSEPWVFNMFVLMGQVRRPGMPQEARELALKVDTTGSTVPIIQRGQEMGVFKEGDPALLSLCFWAAVQGIMEEMALKKEMQAPDPKWIVDVLRK